MDENCELLEKKLEYSCMTVNGQIDAREIMGKVLDNGRAR